MIKDEEEASKVGRPSLYRPEYVEQVVEFCAQGFSLTGFAGEIGVSRDTISEWARAHPEFSVAVSRAKARRALWWEKQAINVALDGGSSSRATMVIFGLKNHAPDDYRDKTEREHSSVASLRRCRSRKSSRRRLTSCGRRSFLLWRSSSTSRRRRKGWESSPAPVSTHFVED
jgi:hypothetical protein